MEPEEEMEFYQNYPREFNPPEPLDGEDPELEMLTNFYAAAVQLVDDTEHHNGSCYNCREKGHYWRNCPQALREEFRVYQETMKRRREMMLNTNGGPGTQGGQVPQASPPVVPLPVPAAPSTVKKLSTPPYWNEDPRARWLGPENVWYAHIDGRRELVLIDSGARANAVTPEYVRKHGLQVRKVEELAGHPTSIPIAGVGGMTDALG